MNEALTQLLWNTVSVVCWLMALWLLWLYLRRFQRKRSQPEVVYRQGPFYLIREAGGYRLKTDAAASGRTWWPAHQLKEAQREVDRLDTIRRMHRRFRDNVNGHA